MIDSDLSFVNNLMEKTYAWIPISEQQASLVDRAYDKWDRFFLGSGKHSFPRDESKPSGYFPLCQTGGCELKESFYLQHDMRPPAPVEMATRGLFTLFGRAAEAAGQALAAVTQSQQVVNPTRGCLRVMRYPPFDDPTNSTVADLMTGLASSGAIRTPEHTDLNSITVLSHATAPGLEILTPAGWLEVTERRRFLLVQVGQELERGSRGQFRATIHRVRNPLPSERAFSRLAAAYFVS